MKVSIIVEARLGSKRLPNKIIYKIKKYLFIEYLIKRLKKSKQCNEIIIATTNLAQDMKLVGIAKKNKVKYFQGSKNNVIKRVIDAGKKFNCKTIVRVTSDCPVIDVSILDKAIAMFRNNNCDYLSNSHIRGYPDGMDVEIFNLKTLIKSYKYFKSEKYKEWTTWAIRKKSKIFKKLLLVPPKELYWPSLGLTLDEYKDYLFLKKIILHFKERVDFSCLDIIKLLNKKKEWLNINKNVKRKGYKIKELKYKF